LAPLNDDLALVAADLGIEHKLPMADSIILATARFFDAEVITSDADFEHVPGVTYVPKPK
jgi:toxin FitB